MRAFLSPRQRRAIPRLIELGRLVPLPSGAIYWDGWDEEQRFNWNVVERQRRRRERLKGTGPISDVGDESDYLPFKVTSSR